MKAAKILAGCLIITAGWSAQAFIPRAQYILRQATDLAGKGPYQIEKNAHFSDGTSTFQLRESWVVDGENALKVTVRNGNQIVYQALFLNGKKHEAGRAGSVGNDFFEKYFVARVSKRWLEELVDEKVLNSDALQSHPVRDLKDYQYSGDSNVRLARTQGLVAFALGPVSDEAPNFWFDQETFQLVRIRTLSGAEIRGNRKFAGPKGLTLPAQVTVSYNGKTVDLQTKSVEALKTLGKNFDPATLAPARWDALAATPLRPAIEEFYTRFR